MQLSRRMLTEGTRLVLTNGCFDILHVGHVRYLESARSMGDALLVAVNNDASVRLLKGPGRPVTSEDDRAEILSALESVSAVVIFKEPTAEALVAEVQPAIYVKGGDYSPDPSSARFPPEGRIVATYGGQVRIVDLVPTRSTTEVLRRMRREG